MWRIYKISIYFLIFFPAGSERRRIERIVEKYPLDNRLIKYTPINALIKHVQSCLCTSGKNLHHIPNTPKLLRLTMWIMDADNQLNYVTG